MGNMTTVHVFEAAGLGKAPFVFDGIEDTAANAGPDGMVRHVMPDGVELLQKPGGSCDYCGNYIVTFCWIRSADGRRFKVGTDCAKKTGDEGIVNLVKREENKRKNERRKEREAHRIAEAKRIIDENDAVREALKSECHPSEWRSRDFGETRLDWCIWMLGNAGNAGKLEVVRFINKVVKAIEKPAILSAPAFLAGSVVGAEQLGLF